MFLFVASTPRARAQSLPDPQAQAGEARAAYEAAAKPYAAGSFGEAVEHYRALQNLDPPLADRLFDMTHGGRVVNASRK